MIQTISNISLIITAVTFIVYLIGRFIRISFSKYDTHERFFLELTSDGDEFIVEAENIGARHR